MNKNVDGNPTDGTEWGQEPGTQKKFDSKWFALILTSNK